MLDEQWDKQEAAADLAWEAEKWWEMKRAHDEINRRDRAVIVRNARRRGVPWWRIGKHFNATSSAQLQRLAESAVEYFPEDMHVLIYRKVGN